MSTNARKSDGDYAHLGIVERRSILNALLFVSILSLISCDNEPTGLIGPPSGAAGSEWETHVAEAADRYRSGLERYFLDRDLIGYGGRRFRIQLDGAIEYQLVRSASNHGADRVIFRLSHWQVQLGASMKYELETVVEKNGESWGLQAVTTRYLGLKQDGQFRQAEGYKKSDVLKDIKGNVYYRPVNEAFLFAFDAK